MWGARMMTDNEIIRALECCQGNADCANCPYYENNHYQCGNNFNKDVLDLINRQKAEIEALQKDKKQLESDIIIANNNYEHIKSIWENDYQKLSQVIAKWKDKYKRLVIQEEDIKAEAVKEFAERLKEYVEPYDVTTGYKIIIVNAVEEETIDNLVKEMVGENK